MRARIRRAWALLLVVPLLLAACQAGMSGASSTATPRATESATTGTAQKNALYSSTTTEPSASQVVQQVRGGIVEIIAESQEGSGRYWQGNPISYATGTGFAIDDQGHILTNYHVVRGADKLTVVLPNNKTETAQLVGYDSQTDLAVLKVKPSGLTPLSLGDSNKLTPGQPVIAIGYALDLEGGPTVTTGVVSATDRSETEPSDQPIEPGAFQDQSGPTLFGLIQTDAAINPGNSGGPLLDASGQVIGINTLGQVSSDSGTPVQGINFAIPINTAKQVAQELIQKGHVTYPYIGIETEFLYPEVSVTNNLPNVLGEYVASVLPNTPASRAGLRRGDVITAIDGQKLTDESTFVELLREHEPGEKVTLTVRHGSKTRQVTVTLATRPSS